MRTFENAVERAAAYLEHNRHFGWFAIGMGMVAVALALMRFSQ